MVDVTVEYKEKLPYKETARVYGKATAAPGESINASDLDLKTIRVAQLTSYTTLSSGPAGSINTPGSINNSVAVAGSPSGSVGMNITVLGE